MMLDVKVYRDRNDHWRHTLDPARHYKTREDAATAQIATAELLLAMAKEELGGAVKKPEPDFFSHSGRPFSSRRQL